MAKSKKCRSCESRRNEDRAVLWKEREEEFSPPRFQPNSETLELFDRQPQCLIDACDMWYREAYLRLDSDDVDLSMRNFQCLAQAITLYADHKGVAAGNELYQFADKSHLLPSGPDFDQDDWQNCKPTFQEFEDELQDLLIRAGIILHRLKTLAHIAMETQGVSHLHNGKKPHWDRERRTLFYGADVIRKYKHRAENQTTILDAFQEQGWPPSIKDPFTAWCNDPQKRRRDTIDDLNEGITTHIGFSSDGTGKRIAWNPK